MLLHYSVRRSAWEIVGLGPHEPEEEEGVDEHDDIENGMFDEEDGLVRTIKVPCLGPEKSAQKGIAFTHYAYVFENQVIA